MDKRTNNLLPNIFCSVKKLKGTYRIASRYNWDRSASSASLPIMAQPLSIFASGLISHKNISNSTLFIFVIMFSITAMFQRYLNTGLFDQLSCLFIHTQPENLCSYGIL